jgi:hypothetical protein
MRGTNRGNHRGTGEVSPPPPRPHLPPTSSKNTYRGSTTTHPNPRPKPKKRRLPPNERTPPPTLARPTDPAGSALNTTPPTGNHPPRRHNSDHHRRVRPRPRTGERRIRTHGAQVRTAQGLPASGGDPATLEPAAVLAEHVRTVIDSFPPLTPGQRDRIAVLLRTQLHGRSRAVRT